MLYSYCSEVKETRRNNFWKAVKSFYFLAYLQSHSSLGFQRFCIISSKLLQCNRFWDAGDLNFLFTQTRPWVRFQCPLSSSLHMKKMATLSLNHLSVHWNIVNSKLCSFDLLFECFYSLRSSYASHSFYSTKSMKINITIFIVFPIVL